MSCSLGKQTLEIVNILNFEQERWQSIKDPHTAENRPVYKLRLVSVADVDQSLVVTSLICSRVPSSRAHISWKQCFEVRMRQSMRDFEQETENGNVSAELWRSQIVRQESVVGRDLEAMQERILYRIDFAKLRL